MQHLRHITLSFIINTLFPVAALDALASGSYWSLEHHLGAAVFVIETTAVLLSVISSVVIGRFLQRQQMEASPYVYKSNYSLVISRVYFGIEATDRKAFYGLLRSVRHSEVMTPLRPWLLINDIAWDFLLAAFIPLLLVLLIVWGFSRLISGHSRVQKAHG